MDDNFDTGNEVNPGKLLRLKEAAAMLAVCPRTVWRMIADGELEAVHIRGCTRVTLRSVVEYLKQHGQKVCV